MSTFTLPDLHATWPFPQIANKFYNTVAPESFDWVASFNLFDAKTLRKFKDIEACWLGALAYPDHSREHFFLACNLMLILFAMDDISDVLSQPEAEKLATIALDALK